MNNAHILKASNADGLTKFVLRHPKTGQYYDGHGFGFSATLDNAKILNGGADLIRTWIYIKAVWCSSSPDKGASIEVLQVGN